MRWLMAKKEEAAHRASICEGCEYKCETKCSKCGCRIDVKTSFSFSTCPENKWDKTEDGTWFNIHGKEE